MGKRCMGCGALIPDDSVFCPECGTPVGDGAGAAAEIIDFPAGGDSIAASVNVGEMEIGGLVAEGAERALAGSPVGELFGGIGGFIGGIFGSLLKPWKLILAAAMAGLWVVLDKYQGSSAMWVKIMSFLTFAEGGRDRASAIGTFGGLLGRGVTAVGLGSIFTGGAASALRGLKGLFTGGEKKSAFGAALGLIAGAGLYIAFAGMNAGASSVMAGVSGALLALKGMGSESGWFYRVAAAFTARVQDGKREIQSGKAGSMMLGIAIGFLGAAAFFALR